MSKLGHFSDNGNRYIITNPQTPRPWLNYLWNNRYLMAVDQFGSGKNAYQNEASFYITESSGRGYMMRDGNRFIYIFDPETGKTWNPGWFPSRTPLNHYQCSHGQADTVIRGDKDEIEIEWTLFVGKTEPAECWIVKVKNLDSRKRSVSLYPFVEFSLDGYVHNSGWESWTWASYSKKNNLVFVCNPAEERPHPYYHGFMATDASISSYDTSRKAFLGTYGNIHQPDSLGRRLSNSNGACEPMICAYQIELDLEAGESKTLHFTAGIANSYDYAEQLADKLLVPGHMEKMLKDVASFENKRCSETFFMESPDEKLNYFANYWLKKQTKLCAEIGRGEGKGFRDQLQDAWATAGFNPELSKRKILEALEQIYHTGRCVRGWLPLKDRNCADGPTWVAPTINAYLKQTGDYDFLNEKVKYLDEGEDSVWEHILTTVRYCSNDVGEHGLVHIHVGEWNDSLNGMGKLGIGESVWVSIALYNSLQSVIEMAEKIRNDSEVVCEMKRRAETIKEAVNQNGWDGEWYLTGYTDYGEKVGSKDNKEGSIYLNSQIWAVMTGIADKKRESLCLHAVKEYLESDYGALTLTPAYKSYRPDIGRLTGFVPGIWENASSYCHGSAFKAVMEGMTNRGDEAVQTIHAILPDTKVNPSDYSGAEPYVLTNMFFGPEHPYPGKTHFSWVTGTAGWIYRAISQEIAGFLPEYDSVTIQPVLPKTWDRLTYQRSFRGAFYDVTVYRTGRYKLFLDGKEMEGNHIPIPEKNSKHILSVEI